MISDIHFQENPLNQLINDYDILGKRINMFIKYVENNWNKKPAISN